MVRALLLLLLLCVSAAQAVPFEELLYKGKAVPFYGTPRAPQHEKLQEVLKQGWLAERMAQVAGAARLRQDLAVGFASCGNANAFFDRAGQRWSCATRCWS